MKIKNILVSLVAILALAAGCNQVEPDHYLSQIQLSSSYLAFPANGGSVTINYVATDSWSIPSLPEFLSVSPGSGNAGEGTISFTALGATETREGSFSIVAGGKSQTINYIQVTQKVEPVTMSVSEALNVIKPLGDGEVAGGTYRVKGIVCKINEISVSYGNATYFLSDDGSYKGTSISDCNWIEVYRGLWLNGGSFTSENAFEVGDEVTVEGLLMNYKGTPETKEKMAFVVSVEKSLIKVDSVDPEDATVSEDGGDVSVTLVNKGNGIYVDIPEEAKDWLSISGLAGNTVTFHAAANQGGERTAAIVFRTTDGKKEYSAQQVLKQKGSIKEVTVAEFLAAEESSIPYRITGVIVGNYASDKTGNSFYIRDWSGETLVYKSSNYYMLGLRPGDVVEVVGKRGAYKGSPQMIEASITWIADVVDDISIPDFIAKPDGDIFYMVSGIIDEIANATWGNLYLKDEAGNRLYVYGCYPGWGASGDARKGLIDAKGIKEGDKLTVIGKKGSKNGVPQVSNGIYFSHQPAD